MSDIPKAPKSLYDTSAGEIATKNFLVGFSRGLGGFLITLLTWAAFYYFSIHFLLPQLTGIFSEAKSMIQSIEKIQGAMSPTTSGTTNLMAPSGTKTQSTTPTATEQPAGIVISPEMIRQFQQMQQQK